MLIDMFSESAAYFAVRAINGLLALSTLALLTRLLEPSEYGGYALGMAAMTVLATVLFQWLNVAVARFHAAHAQQEDALLTLAQRLFFQIAVFSLAGVVVFLIVQPFPRLPPATALAIGLGAIALGLHDLHLQIANARKQPLRYGLITSSRGGLALALAVVLVTAGAGATGALAAFGVACLLAVALYGARWRWRAPADRSTLQRHFVVFGLPIAFGSVSTMVLAVLDRFLIGVWHGNAAVAGYAAAYDLTQQTVGVVLNVFFMAAYPRVTAAWEAGGITAARATIVPLSRALLLVGPLTISLFAGLAPEIAAFMFGAGIRTDAAIVIPWVALAIGIGCVKAYLLDVAFHLSKSTAVLLRITAAMAAVNVVLNVILIPPFGFIGAALAALSAFSVGAAMSWWLGRRVGVYPPLAREVLKAIVVVGSVIVILRLIGSSGFFGGLGSGFLAGAIRLVAGVAAFGGAAWLIDLSALRSSLMRRRPPDLDRAS